MAISTRRSKTPKKRVTKKVAKRAARKNSKATKKKPRRAAPKISRTRKPDGMSLEAWQTALRRQFGREQNFELSNLGSYPFFSEFHVTNPKTNGIYRVAIRGTSPGENFCECPDYATNTLGTCKHIEFTLGRLERKRGGKRALREGFQPPYSEIYLQYGARRAVRFRPGEECPVELARLASRYFDDEGLLKANAFAKFETFLSNAAKIKHELRCYDDALDFVAAVRDEEHRRSRLEEMFPRGIDSARFKKLLRVELYEYQREGALFATRAGRCLIGDEMGLGKTIQALAAIEILAELCGVERVLIVCPTSLKHQWEREIEKFSGRPTQVIGGRITDREAQFSQGSFYSITNYDTIHRDLESIENLSPDLVILDEAQRIKNWETRTAKSVKQIQSPYCMVLTGTPLENRLEELFSIVQFIDQHRLGPMFRFLDEHQLVNETGRVVGYQNLDRIGKTLAPILIRRQKKQVLNQLPERLDKQFFVPMTPEQNRHHEENAETVARVVAKWRRYGFLSEADQRRLMISLQNMRMACDSTYLLDQKTDFGVKPDELTTLLHEALEQPDTKAVVFSQWVRMHELNIRRFEGASWDHVFFHGGVASNKRKDLIDRFRGDANCRVFLSTDAGGVGLNLQHANMVINMDLPWNPAVLEQRIGRVHRLGQKQPVQVINFIAKGTIEEGMLSVLSFKKSLFAGVLDGGESEVFLGKSRLNKFIETVENVTSNVPQTTLEPSAATTSPSQLSPAEPDEIASATVNDDPLAGLLQTGLALLERLASSSGKPASTGKQQKPFPKITDFLKTERDEVTGQPFLKLPMPQPEVLERTLQAIGTVLESFRR